MLTPPPRATRPVAEQRGVTDGSGNHGNNERCTFTARYAMTVSASSFNTENYFDRITIGSTRYSGSNGPSGVSMTAGSTMILQAAFEGQLLVLRRVDERTTRTAAAAAAAAVFRHVLCLNDLRDACANPPSHAHGSHGDHEDTSICLAAAVALPALGVLQKRVCEAASAMPTRKLSCTMSPRELC